MAVGADKVRTPLSIDKDLKQDLEKIAELEDRSMNSLIVSVLRKYAKEYKKNADE